MTDETNGDTPIDQRGPPKQDGAPPPVTDRPNPLRDTVLRQATEITRLRGILADVANQYAGKVVTPDGVALCHDFLSSMEAVFAELGWGHLHPAPHLTCDEPGCNQECTCGIPTEAGYRSVCHEHSKGL